MGNWLSNARPLSGPRKTLAVTLGHVERAAAHLFRASPIRRGGVGLELLPERGGGNAAAETRQRRGPQTTWCSLCAARMHFFRLEAIWCL